MSINRTVWGDAITEVSTSKIYPLGTLREEQNGSQMPYPIVAPFKNSGPQVWRYVQIDAGVTVTAGLAVKLKNAADSITGPVVLGTTTTPKCRAMGVVQHVIAASSYGWVLCKGWGTGQSDGGTTADTSQTCAAAGQLTDGTLGTTEQVGFAAITEDPAGAGGLFRIFVDML